MTIAAKDRERMLPAQGGDPEVVRWNGFSGPPRFEMDCRVVMCSSLVYVEHSAIFNEPIQLGTVPGDGIGRCRSDTPLGPQREALVRRPLTMPRRWQGDHRQPPKAHSRRESLPVLGFDLFE